MHIVGFTPVHAIVGGALMGIALSIILIATGRLAGLSGVVAGVLWPGDRSWHVYFLGGALAVGATNGVLDEIRGEQCDLGDAPRLAGRS